MSLMNDMLGDMLKKAIPAEVLAMMTPENMAAFKANAESLVVELREGIAKVQLQNIEILERLERIENVGRDDSSSARKPRAGNAGQRNGVASGKPDE